MIAASQRAATPLVLFVFGRRDLTVMEEKVTHIFKLNAQHRRWGDLFDAVAGACLVVGGETAPTAADQSAIVVATMFASPDKSVVDMAGLVSAISEAIADGERGAIAKMIEAGRPRADARTWATAGRMVEIVRRVRGLREPTVSRLVEVIRMVGEHPLMLGFPDR